MSENSQPNTPPRPSLFRFGRASKGGEAEKSQSAVEKRALEPPRPRVPFGYRLLWLLTLLSLLFNAIVFNQLVMLRRMSHQAVSDARTIVSEFKNETFEYKFHIEDEVPVDMVFPFEGTFTVPFKDTFYINQTVHVTVTIPVLNQEVPLSIPVQTAVPIDTTVTVPVSEEIPVNMLFPINMDVPVAIGIADTPLYGSLEAAEQSLADLEEELAQPIIRLPGSAAGARPDYCAPCSSR
jgi:hypothetical protein